MARAGDQHPLPNSYEAFIKYIFISIKSLVISNIQPNISKETKRNAFDSYMIRNFDVRTPFTYDCVLHHAFVYLYDAYFK